MAGTKSTVQYSCVIRICDWTNTHSVSHRPVFRPTAREQLILFLHVVQPLFRLITISSSRTVVYNLRASVLSCVRSHKVKVINYSVLYFVKLSTLTLESQKPKVHCLSPDTILSQLHPLRSSKSVSLRCHLNVAILTSVRFPNGFFKISFSSKLYILCVS
jgi:hypothetical protein